MDEGDALRRNGNPVHAELHEVADTGTNAAVQHKHILAHLEFRRYLGLQDMFEFGFAEEEGLVVLHPHHDLEALMRDFAEGRFENLIRILQLIEEGPQALHLMDHGVVGDAVGGVALATVLHIQLRVLLNVQVLIGHKSPIVHQHLHVKLLRHHVRVALDVEEPFHPPAHGVIVHVPVLSNHAITIGLLDIPLEPLYQVLIAVWMEDGFRRVGVKNLVHLNLQDLAPHVHSCNLHVVVGRVDGGKVLLNLIFEFGIIDGDPGAQRAFGRKDGQLLIRYFPPRRIVHGQGPPVRDPEPQVCGSSRRCRSAVKCNSFHTLF